MFILPTLLKRSHKEPNVLSYWMLGLAEEVVMAKHNCDVGLDQRCRDNDGEIRQKRGDTMVRTLRKTYGEDFAAGVRGDAKLETLRERAGGESLSKLVKVTRRGGKR